MSNGELDQLSIVIGRLEADIKHIRSSTDVMNEKVNNINDHTIRQEASVKSAHKRIDHITTEFKDVKNKVDNHENLKNKGIGLIAIVGIAVSTAGTAIINFLKHVFVGG
jgi:predicted  nucleic acid-binding Zn-ribbon protein